MNKIRLNSDIIYNAIHFNMIDEDKIVIMYNINNEIIINLFLKNEKLDDIYRIINIYYPTLQNIQLKYYNKENNIYFNLPKNDELIKNYLIKNSKPVLDYPERIVYEVVIDEDTKIINKNIVYDKIKEYIMNENKIVIIYSKCCGYHFAHFFIENEELKRIYDIINLYYPNYPNIKLKYKNANNDWIELPNNEDKIKNYLLNNSVSVLKNPENITYQILVENICTENHN